MTGRPHRPGRGLPVAAGSAVSEFSRLSLLPSSPDAMSGKPLQRTVTITNPMGLHLRPAAAFAKLASTFTGTVTVAKDDRRVNGKSLMELMLLAAEQGTSLTIEAAGADAEAALDALAEVLGSPGEDDEDDPPLPPKG